MRVARVPATGTVGPVPAAVRRYAAAWPMSLSSKLHPGGVFEEYMPTGDQRGDEERHLVGLADDDALDIGDDPGRRGRRLCRILDGFRSSRLDLSGSGHAAWSPVVSSAGIGSATALAGRCWLCSFPGSVLWLVAGHGARSSSSCASSRAHTV